MLVIGGRHLFALQPERLRLAVKRQDIGRVFLRNHTGLQAAPECATQVALGDLRDEKGLFALRDRRNAGLHGAVVLCAVRPYLTEHLQRRVLVRRNHHFGQQRRFLPHGDLQSCHRTGFDLKALGIIADGGEDELRFRGHVHAQRVGTAGIGRGAYLGAAKMNVDIRYCFARRLVDYLADDDRLDGMERSKEEGANSKD